MEKNPSLSRGGAAERPDLLDLVQSGRVGAKSVSDEDDYLAVPELLQRVESGYEAVRQVSRVHGLFPLSTDLTNEYLKKEDRRLPAQEEYLWMSCCGAHMAALFVALDELLPYVPAASQDFTPYLARARNHAEAIDKAFRIRLAFLRRLNEVKRVHGDQGVLERQQLQGAGVDEDVAVDAGVAARDAFGSDELGQRTLDLLSSPLTAQTLKSYAGRLSQFAEFCHDSENISPPEATTATVVRYVAWIGERGHIGAKSLQPYLSAINTFFELHNLDPIAKDNLHLNAARRVLMLRQRRLEAAPLRVPQPADVAYIFVEKAELIVSAPTTEYQHDFRALVASVVNFMFFARGLTSVSCRVWDVHVDDDNITLQVYREKGRGGRRGPDDMRVLLLPYYKIHTASRLKAARIPHGRTTLNPRDDVFQIYDFLAPAEEPLRDLVEDGTDLPASSPASSAELFKSITAALALCTTVALRINKRGKKLHVEHEYGAEVAKEFDAVDPLGEKGSADNKELKKALEKVKAKKPSSSSSRAKPSSSSRKPESFRRGSDNRRESGRREERPPSGRSSAADITCYRCQRKGHFSRDCPSARR
eukprot:jgi/Tetstr1/465841/TSEL_010461.t1